MNRAIQLGANALGTAAPNPMVGAVVVYRDRIIGEGFTSPYGGPHAEVNAIASVRERELLPEATLYVTLEPCSHFGKTPPCADHIIKHAIPEVVIGIRDPHEKVGGKGIQRLEEAGCKVRLGVLEAACREHHRRFLCFHEKKRPYIILKWAQSPDGFLAPDKDMRQDKRRPFWISNTFSRRLVHQWRSQEQAILVGSTTVLDDNPQLNTRDWKGKSPLRIILDRDLSVKGDAHVLDRTVKTLFFTAINDPSQYQEGIAYDLMDFEAPQLASRICERLHGLDLCSLIVEGGARTLQTFIDEGLWDEARIFSGAGYFGGGLEAPRIHGREWERKPIGDNILSILRHD